MKKVLLLTIAILSVSISQAQDYLDIARLNIGNTTLENIDEDDDFETQATNVNLEFLYPTPLSKKTVMITGFTFENTTLRVSPFLTHDNLTMTRLNLGVKVYHSRKWTGTYLILPKLAGNYEEIGGNDFQIGVIALLEQRLKNRFRMKYGIYTSTEEFGQIITPLVGVYYRTPNNKFYIDAAFPIRMEANYSLTKSLSLGADLRTSIKSYNLSGLDGEGYVQEESIRAALYAGVTMLDDKFIARVKLGLDTTDYGLYDSDETIGAQVLTAAIGGDDRNRLNTEFDSAIFLGVDLIYRLGL